MENGHLARFETGYMERVENLSTIIHLTQTCGIFEHFREAGLARKSVVPPLTFDLALTKLLVDF